MTPREKSAVNGSQVDEGDGETQVALTLCWNLMDKLEWPSKEDLRVKPSLIFFYRIHSGTMFVDIGKYLTLAPNLPGHQNDSQYTRYMT